MKEGACCRAPSFFISLRRRQVNYINAGVVNNFIVFSIGEESIVSVEDVKR